MNVRNDGWMIKYNQYRNIIHIHHQVFGTERYLGQITSNEFSQI